MIAKDKTIFVDVDNTLLVTRSMNSFSAFDCLSPEQRNLPPPERKLAKDALFQKMELAIDDTMEANPVKEWQGDLMGYEYSMKTLSKTPFVEAAGWHVFTLDDNDSYAMCARPWCREFLEEVRKLGSMWICSTAMEDYLEYALGHMGVLDMFDGVIHRKTLYGPGYHIEQGWEWEGDPKFVLIDDLGPAQAGLKDKLYFLGLPLTGMKLSGWSGNEIDDPLVEAHTVRAPSFYEPDPSDIGLDSILEEVKTKATALGE